MKSPDSPDIKLARGKLLMERGQEAEAIPFLTDAIKSMPQNADALYERGLAFENLALSEKAIDDYEACLKLDRFHIGAMNNKAVQLAKLKRHTEAIAAFSAVVDLDPEDFLGYRNRALCRFDLHEQTEALEDYATALKLNPDDATSWYQRGNVYLAMNSLEAADRDFTKALELDPDFAKAWMNRGVVRYRQNRKSLAAEDLTKAQDLDDNIVIPAINVFSDVTPIAAATEVLAESTWNNYRSSVTEKLAARGFTELVFVKEFPDLKCAELMGEIHGESRTVLVTIQAKDKAFATLPYVDFKSLTDGEQPLCSLLVLRLSDKKGTVSEVVRFDLEWNPKLRTGEPVVMDYQL